jgi:hypothetical protein
MEATLVARDGPGGTWRERASLPFL